MARFSGSAVFAAVFIAGASMTATPSFAAGPCGGFLAVDAPTTLQAAARACNVSYAALREANPGVNPGNIRPGQHLSVPTSLRHAAVNNSAIPVSVSSAPSKIDGFTRDLGFREETDRRVRIFAANYSPGAPSWLEDNNEGGHYTSAAPLSFQKASALRIEVANNAAAPSADGIPQALFTNNSKTTQGYRLPDYNSIGVLPDQNANQLMEAMSLSGSIVNAYGDCFTLRTESGELWRLSASDDLLKDADKILGKTVTVWGSKSATKFWWRRSFIEYQRSSLCRTLEQRPA